MPSKICCSDNHATKGISIHDAAIAISEGRAIGTCKKCGKGLQYRIDHVFPGDPQEKQHSFAVTRAVRLWTRLTGNDGYDPFLLVLRQVETGKERILPTFWVEGQTAQRGGQFPPLLTFEEWKTLFRRLDASFDELEERIRIRAYELYEKRGRREGSAMADWLQAEAELTARDILGVAA
ncbi:MAG TPA: DUF2934 domain-containing protein [Candidatus Acidoferrales bacterium]